MEETRRIGFFKRLKMSIFEPENYIQFTVEKTSKSIWFAIRMVIIFALIIVFSGVMYIHFKYQTLSNYISSIVPEFSYNEHNLVIEEEQKKDENKKVVANLMQQLEPTYREILPDNSQKADLIHFVENNEKEIMIFLVSTLFFETIFVMFLFWLMMALLTSLVGLIVLRISRIKVKFSRLYALSIYASTLSMILTFIYTIINNYFGIYIDIFDYLSMLIAYIYITAVIYMIKSDLLKQHIEFIKIATAHVKNMEQLHKENDKEDKKDEEQGKSEKQDEESKDEPDGSEI